MSNKIGQMIVKNFQPLILRINLFMKKSLKDLIRARRKLINTKQSHLVNRLYTQLLNKPNYPGLSFLGVEIKSIQIRQYTLQKLSNAFVTNTLIKSLADKKTPQVYPFPKNLREQLESNNIRVKNAQSEILWRFKCSTHLGFAFINLLNILRFDKIDIGQKTKNLDLYIHGVRKESILVSQTNEELDNILSFFKHRNKTDKIMVYLVGDKNTSFKYEPCIVKSPFFGFSFANKINIIFYFSILAVRAFWDLIFGSGYLIFMSNEIMLKKLALKINDKYIAKEYAFSQSNISYFPAWLDVLSQRGAYVTLYFYSHNLLPMQMKDEIQEWHYLYHLLNWPNYLVWDKNFGNEIKKIALNLPHIEVSNPISVVDNVHERLDISKYIAIFDVTPVRPSALGQYGIVSTIYDDEFSKAFFLKIISVAAELKQPMVVKPKRSNSVPTTKRFRRLMTSLSNDARIKILNPEISAKRVILNCKASISMPFTSPAIIAKSLHKPSIYFDPFGDFKKNQIASLDVDIISNENKLISWMQSIN